MKKLFSFALTAVLVMSVSTAVFAYSEPNCGGGGGWGVAVPKSPFPTVTPNNLSKPPIGGFFQLPLC
ncbi:MULTISPECIES: hypothetical protein [Bacillales]|uniref:hypothetical protein n=1 Tax=Bacillales TaxID=1385 RepID=UPI000364089F|nr:MULTISPECIES: hypothetical protein [Bacillales]KMZ41721.1 hypothetical protein AC624_11815 [Bacillus sp. FJAT-27238]